MPDKLLRMIFSLKKYSQAARTEYNRVCSLAAKIYLYLIIDLKQADPAAPVEPADCLPELPELLS